MIITLYMMFSVSFMGSNIIRRYYYKIFASASNRELGYMPIAKFLATVYVLT